MTAKIEVMACDRSVTGCDKELSRFLFPVEIFFLCLTRLIHLKYCNRQKKFINLTTTLCIYNAL